MSRRPSASIPRWPTLRLGRASSSHSSAVSLGLSGSDALFHLLSADERRGFSEGSDSTRVALTQPPTPARKPLFSVIESAPSTQPCSRLSSTMALSQGARLGPYEILSALGAGGMGEVYKARDTRLDRTLSHWSDSDLDLRRDVEAHAAAVPPTISGIAINGRPV